MRKLFVSLMMVFAITACSEDIVAPADRNPVSTVSINQLGRLLFVGDTITLSAAVAGDSGAVVSWGASTDLQNPLVRNVELNSRGFLRVLRAGQTRVIATAGNKSDTLLLTTGLLPVRSVVVTPLNPAYVGANAQFTAQLFDARDLPLGGEQRTFRWEVVNPTTDLVDTTVARINQQGVLMGRTTGTTRVRLVVDGVASGSVDVAVGLVPVGYVTITPDTIRVGVQGTRQVVARAFRGDSTELTSTMLHGRTWTWAVGNTSVAAVSSTGLVTGVAVGTTTVTATIGGVSRTVPVIVE
jgi:hypothetical protein